MGMVAMSGGRRGFGRGIWEGCYGIGRGCRDWGGGGGGGGDDDDTDEDDRGNDEEAHGCVTEPCHRTLMGRSVARY